jgi:hypothetical protein
MSEPINRDAIAKGVADAFAARGQTVDANLIEEITAGVEASLAGSGATVSSPKTLAQEIVGNLAEAARAAEAQQKR